MTFWEARRFATSEKGKIILSPSAEATSILAPLATTVMEPTEARRTTTTGDEKPTAPAKKDDDKPAPKLDESLLVGFPIGLLSTSTRSSVQ